MFKLQARLFSLALAGDPKAVAQFLERNPTANLDDTGGENGRTPLMVACHKGHLAIAQLLLERKADPNIVNKEGVTALTFAATFLGGVPCCALLIKFGADLKSHGARALCDAAHGGKLETCEFLLKSGVDPNAKTPTDWTPLRSAADGGQLAACQLLVKYRADPKATSGKVDETPLERATEKGHEDIVAFLKPLTEVHVCACMWR